MLVLFNSGVASFVVSFFAAWLPGANGRFDEKAKRDRRSLPETENDALLLSRQSPHSSQPKRPRRLFLPVLVLCVVLRLEIVHRVTYDFQCTSPGVEVCRLN